MNDTMNAPQNGPINDEETLRLVQSGLPPDQLRAEVTRRLVQRTEAEEPEWGALLRAAAIPRRLDQGVVGLLRGAPDDAQGNQAALQRLASYSFVLPDPEGRSYALHEEVRAVLLEDWQAPERRARYAELSQALHGHALAADQGWEALYHRFAFDPAGALAEFERRFYDAHVSYRRAECGALLAAAEEQQRELDEGQRRRLRYYRARLALVMDRWAEAEAGYRALLAELPPSPPAPVEEEGRLRTWTLHDLGTALDSQGKWAEAVEVYQEALKGFRELGNRDGEGRTLHNMGIGYQHQGRLAEALEMYEESLSIYRELGDRSSEAHMLRSMGIVYDFQGHRAEALRMYEKSLSICRELGDRRGEGRSLVKIGDFYRDQKRWAEALGTYDQSLAIYRDLGDRHGEERTLVDIGNIYRDQERWAEALEMYGQSLHIRQELGDHLGKGQTLVNIGNVYESQNRWAEALEMYDQSLRIFQELGYRPLEGATLVSIGDVYQDQARWAKALEMYDQALRIYRELGGRRGEGMILHIIGSVYQVLGRWTEALEVYDQGLRIWRELGDRHLEGKTLAALAELHAQRGRVDEAVAVWQEALALFKELGAPEAARVEDSLALAKRPVRLRARLTFRRLLRRLGWTQWIAVRLRRLGAVLLQSGERSQQRAKRIKESARRLRKRPGGTEGLGEDAGNGG